MASITTFAYEQDQTKYLRIENNTINLIGRCDDSVQQVYVWERRNEEENAKLSGITRIIKPGSKSNEYISYHTDSSETPFAFNGYCDEGDVAKSATCTFDKGANMSIIPIEDDDTGELYGYACEFDIADEHYGKGNLGSAKISITCEK